MKPKDLLVPAVAVVGGAIVVNQIMKMIGGAVGGVGETLAALNPIPYIGQGVSNVGAAAQNWAEDIQEEIATGTPGATSAVLSVLGPVGGIGGGVLNIAGLLFGSSGNLTLTPESGHHGDVFQLTATRLNSTINAAGNQAVWPLEYGWKELNFKMQLASINGRFESDVNVDSSTPPGTYTIYIDQTRFGGPYYEKKFIVLNDNEAPKSSFWNFFGVPLPQGVLPEP